MRVYVDVAFAVNAAVDYLLLLSSSRLSGFPVRQRRLILAAVLGGLFAAASFFSAFLCTPAAGVLLLAGMLLTAYGTGPGFWRQGMLFLLVSMALAGLVYLVAQFLDRGLILLNRRAYYPVSGPALLITAGLGYLGMQTALRRCVQHSGRELARVVIRTAAGQAVLSALRDTGNTLRDPMTGQPVLIVDRRALARMLPEVQTADLTQPAEAFAAMTARLPLLSWRLLPYRVVGGNGLLLAFRAQTVQVDGKQVAGMTVAISPTPVSDGGGYMGLLGGEL